MDVNTSKMINLDAVNYHAWKDELYAGKTGSNKLYLMKKFMNLKYRDDTTIIDHLNDMQGIVDQLAIMKISFEDEVLALWLLGSFGTMKMGNNGMSMIIGIVEASNGSRLTLKDVKHVPNIRMKHLCMFPRMKKSKLDLKTRACIFLGYGNDEFGYRFYDLARQKLVRSRDVVFFKDQTIEDIDKVVEKHELCNDGQFDIELTYNHDDSDQELKMIRTTQVMIISIEAARLEEQLQSEPP
ncbi:hypothetical protein Patl1_31100 [Pistacia atlantica]|uniref:Uncharacterized protein n=1 Tax=Pistacia atlantica TaxID=434234 RepID=A0ACC1AAM3_9ROSI|nr:hypothetical protein Patl1_31100 [Pistacia atlantica]